MNSNRSLRLVKLLALALLTACFGASLANAQAFQGTFHLPFEVRWRGAVLPPGDYSFTLNSGDTSPVNCVLVARKGQPATFIMPLTLDHSSSGESALIVVGHGERRTVRALRLAQADLVIYYPVSKADRQMVAQVPELIQRLPISMAGK
jgi:ribosomal protein L30/L7E